MPPPPLQLEAEKLAPPDLAIVARRIKEVVGVLENFAARRNPDRSRADYLAQVGGPGWLTGPAGRGKPEVAASALPHAVLQCCGA